MKLFDHGDPQSLVSHLRRRRSHLLRTQIETIAQITGRCRVLDVGGEGNYWLHTFGMAWLLNHHVHVTLLNHTDEYVGRDLPEALFTVVIADGCALPYAPATFDLAHSNSVIEHVGDRARQATFAAELRRAGLRYDLQTPARCFPLEPHVLFPLFQYLPSSLPVWLFQHVALGNYPRVDRAHAEMFDRELQLLTRQWLQELFPDGAIFRERLLGLTKSYMVTG